METWSAPPEFGEAGESPPIRSPLKPTLVEHIGKLSDKPIDGPLATYELYSSKFANDEDLRAARLWLMENFARERVHSVRQSDLPRVRAVPATTAALTPLILGASGAIIGYMTDRFQRYILKSRGQLVLLRLKQYSFWERNDPVSRLAPGTSSTISTRYTVGLSITDSRELATTLGLDFGFGSGNKLSAGQSEKLARSITGTVQHEVSRADTVSNPSNDKYRLYAIWRAGCRIEIERLAMHNGQPAWDPTNIFVCYTDAGFVSTSKELPL